MHVQTTFENLGTVITDYIKETTIKMTKELELEWELTPIAKQTINDLFVAENLVHISTVENTDQYVVVDCEQEYFDWWIENKAEPDDFINEVDYEDFDWLIENKAEPDDFINEVDYEDFDWWIENKAEPDDFINDSDYDHEDGCTSYSKTLNPDIDIWNIKDFSEFVRAKSKMFWLKDNEYNLEIELNQLLHDLSKFKVIDKSKVTQDITKKINSIKLTCRNIGFLE